jgi:parallel beta-helix repeat protein
VLGISYTRNQYFGFVIAESARSVVRNSAGNDNPRPDGDGIGIFWSRGLRIVGSSFRRNALGMHVEDSTKISIARNRFARNTDPGILMEANRNQVRGNRCSRNAECILIRGNRNVVAANRSFRDGWGVGIEMGRGNLVAGNVIVRARWSGIRLGIDNPPIGGTGTVVRRDSVRGSGRSGIEVSRHDRHSRLHGNTARGSRDDGFDVESRSATLTNNRALRNADLGIEAVSGALDAGGNIARHNGDPRQCTQVRCW